MTIKIKKVVKNSIIKSKIKPVRKTNIITKPKINQKINLVIFHSEGPPHDNGLKINNLQPLFNIAKTHVNNIEVYTPRKLKSMGYEKYVQEYPNTGLVKCNPGMKNIGFCAWRPLIIKLELDKMKEGDILVYRDCNIHKYKGLLNYNNFSDICLKFLKICNFDFCILREKEHLPLKYHCKTNIIRELGNNENFYYEFPLLISNFIIIRKSKISEELNNEWLKYCEIKEYIDGEIYGELYKDFRWSTPEQSILSIIIASWIKNRKHNIPLNYPNILSNRSFNFDKIIHPKNFSYLKYL